MRTKHRVLLVNSNLEFGGAQRQLVELANNMPEDFEPVVCALSDYAPLAEFLRIPDENFLVIKKRWKYDVSLPFRLGLEARARKIDVIHAYMFDAEIASRIGGAVARVPVVIGSERNSDYRVKKNQMLAYKITKSLRDHCIANSKRGAEFNSQVLGYPKSHYSVVMNGVDTDRFTADSTVEIRRSLNVADDKFVIGMFASFKQQKNHPMAMRALKKLRERGVDFHVLFVGDALHGDAQNTSASFDQVVELGKSLGLDDRCSYVGNVQDVHKYYQSCDVTILPSRNEGTPNVVLESLACGVPAIVSNVSSNDQIVDDGSTGFIVELDDDDALCERLLDLELNADKRAIFGQNARRAAVDRFSLKALGENSAAVYRKLLSQRG